MKFDKNDEMSPFTKKVMGAFNFCGDKLLQISRKTDTVPGKIPEVLFLILFAVCYSLVLAVHEPGMDVLYRLQSCCFSCRMSSFVRRSGTLFWCRLQNPVQRLRYFLLLALFLRF